MSSRAARVLSCCVTPVLLAAVLASSCARGERRAGGAAAGIAVDDFGDTLLFAPAGPTARRIISLNPTATEILFAIGAGDALVGRDTYSHWPAAAVRVPDLGNAIRPNVEALLAARPDLVLLYASEDNRGAATRLRQAGVATAAFKVDRIAQFYSLARLLGRLTGDSARAAFVADTVRRTLDSVRALTNGADAVSVVLPTWDQPLIVIGGGSFMNELVTIAGGRNIYDSLPSPSPTVTFEDVIRRNPDAVLAGPERAAIIRASPRWQALAAVRNGRVLVVDTNVVLRPAVRLGEGAVSLAKLLQSARRP